jgi:DNA-binding response OmpR family regulator
MQKNKIKVLIIDDNDSILQYLKTFLERYMFEVRTSCDGYEGIQYSAEFKPDIIFLDLMMPNIDGLKMLQLKKVLNDIKDIPVIVISANTARKNVLAAIESGADRVLSKPINTKQLKATVDELLGGRNFEVRNNRSSEQNNDVVKLKKEIAESFIISFEDKKTKFEKAINGRDANTIKQVAESILIISRKLEAERIINISEELKNKEYQKPSDWMYADMKIKQISQIVKEIKRQYS